MSYLQSLTRYKQWANALLYNAAKNIAEEELAKPRPIIFGNLLRTLNHTYCMDLIWQAHLQGKPHNFKTRNPEDCPSLKQLHTTQQKIDNWYVNYADSLSETQQKEIVHFTFIDGGEGAMSRKDILIHIVNHGTYHRGNVTGMMYECGVEVPTTDYPVFLRSIHACNQTS